MTSTLGIEMAVCTVLGAYLGYKLDGRFDTLPWLTAIGVLLGMAAGIWGIIQTLKRYL
ncbi:MAG: AtpZ/AtpI family protein [Clostridia bacterium]|nr:AtpZ/AtpI family protein [Clostridia bacterium]